MAYDIGVQIYTYRDFTIDEVCEELADTDVTAIELMDTHLAPDADESAVDEALTALDDAGIEVRGYYGGSFDADGLDDARERFAFARELGADYVSCDFPPDLADTVAEVAAEHDLLVGVHNHGPGARYQTIEDVLAAVEDSPDRVGACVDTGHFLRMDEHPDEVVPALGDYIHAVHVKDFVDAETEVVPEEGRLDLAELVSLLDEHADLTTPLTIEYEADFEDPTPAVEQTARRLVDLQR
ncbi:sugar phosphate isomerase/epimerase family protein [Halosimplex amylolyticum]|uniref:sugar phosphate isomerase/epimerase family protein n=1 Tax=Halosimplex amylolyticum TaxID=3396616 RepID=UPI003F5755FB